MAHQNALVLARHAAKLTQIQLAAQSGVPQATISGLESGRTDAPTWRTAVALARALDVDPVALFADLDAPAPRWEGR